MRTHLVLLGDKAILQQKFPGARGRLINLLRGLVHCSDFVLDLTRSALWDDGDHDESIKPSACRARKEINHFLCLRDLQARIFFATTSKSSVAGITALAELPSHRRFSLRLHRSGQLITTTEAVNLVKLSSFERRGPDNTRAFAG